MRLCHTSQALYRKPIMIRVGRRGEDGWLLTSHYFRCLLLDLWKVCGT